MIVENNEPLDHQIEIVHTSLRLVQEELRAQRKEKVRFDAKGEPLTAAQETAQIATLTDREDPQKPETSMVGRVLADIDEVTRIFQATVPEPTPSTTP